MTFEIDLNADVGEGCDDAALFPYLSSCNIACGAHAGGPEVMRETLALARGRGVACGAHPGYPDREGFGRREMALTLAELSETVAQQVGALEEEARRAEIELTHVKPHGALYHACNRRADIARAVAEAILRRHPRLVVVGMAGSAFLERARRAGLRAAAEAFADRGYLDAATLAPRGSAGALIEDPERAAAQALAIARREPFPALSGEPIVVEARTICLHGDTPGAAENARAVRSALDRAGVLVRPLSR